MRALRVAACAVALAGCYRDVVLVAEEPAEAGAADSAAPPALVVVGLVAAEARVGTPVVTRFALRLARASRPVDDATVTIASARGVETLARAAAPGAYAGSQSGYAGSYALSVDSGAEHIEAALEGPALHAIARPRQHAYASVARPLEIEWRPAGAEWASVETRGWASAESADTGAFELPAWTLAPPDDRVREDYIGVRRGVRLAVPGAGAGSGVTFTVYASVEVLATAP